MEEKNFPIDGSKKTKNRPIIILLLVVTFGLLAGIVGELISRVYLFENAYNIPLFGDISFTGNNHSGANLVIRGAKNVVVEQNVKVTETIDSLSGNLAGVFEKIKTTDILEKNSKFNINSYYRLNQPFGLGLIITSDGWILTDVFPKNLDNESILSKYVIITTEKKIYEIDKIIKDVITPFSFIHAKGVKDFPVRPFAERGAIKNGQLAIAVNWAGESWLTSVIGKKNESGLSKSSDNFSDEIILGLNQNKAIKESVIVDLSGNIIAVAGSQGKIEPISHLQSAIKSLLRNKNVQRARLGVSYVDLSLLAKDGNKYERGALIYKGEGEVSVIKNGPADLAGLKEGDIIIEVDNVEINKDNNLTDVIQNYLAGEKIKIVYLRANEKQEVMVELGEIK